MQNGVCMQGGGLPREAKATCEGVHASIERISDTHHYVCVHAVSQSLPAQDILCRTWNLQACFARAPQSWVDL